MVALPTGTVTFLLTDVEGSTWAWQAAAGGRWRWRSPVTTRSSTAAIEAHGGSRPQEQGEGDSVVGRVQPGVRRDRLRRLRRSWRCSASCGRAGWTLRVRMGIHTGEAVQRGEDNYVGAAIIRTARIRNAGHGGQILVSDSAAAIAGDALPEGAALVDLGVAPPEGSGPSGAVVALAHPDLTVVDGAAADARRVPPQPAAAADAVDRSRRARSATSPTSWPGNGW